MVITQHDRATARLRCRFWRRVLHKQAAASRAFELIVCAARRARRRKAPTAVLWSGRLGGRKYPERDEGCEDSQLEVDVKLLASEEAKHVEWRHPGGGAPCRCCR